MRDYLTITLEEQALRLMETLEFIIFPDGRVQEKVTGIIGVNCAEVTAAIEAQLGRVVKVEQTAEYFSPASQLSNQTQTQSYVQGW